MDIHPGDIVYSKAGRDQDKYFIVLKQADENHVFICDGDIRRVDKPKRKKIKHLKLMNDLQNVSEDVQYVKDKINNSQKITNAEARKYLSAFVEKKMNG